MKAGAISEPFELSPKRLLTFAVLKNLKFDLASFALIKSLSILLYSFSSLEENSLLVILTIPEAFSAPI